MKPLLALLPILIVGVMVYRDLDKSLFFRAPDRLNILVYGQYPTYFSLGLKDKVNYYYRFDPDSKVKVPGGYGDYRTGAVGKLVFLEKKPDLLRRTFSLATRSFVRDYFYRNDAQIYYSGGQAEAALPGPVDFLQGSSNAGIGDRLYLLLFFWGKSVQNFVPLSGQSADIGGENIFLNDQFGKSYGGYFYDGRYRTEKLNVQILYQKSYSTALSLSRMIEGSGIRVGDISWHNARKGQCRVRESGSRQSLTAAGLVGFFGCMYNREDTGIFDIILELNDAEGEWAV